jgi:hypothetical protein
MRLGAGQASAKLAFLARLCATRGTADEQRWFLLGFHDHMMPDYQAEDWSIVTSAFPSSREYFCPDPRHVWSILTSLQVHSR